MLPTAHQLRHWPRSGLLWAVGGAANGLRIVVFYTALQNAPVAAATAVYYPYPLLVPALSMTRRAEWARAALIVAGAVACPIPITLSSGSVGFLLLVMAAPLSWSAYLLLLAALAPRFGVDADARDVTWGSLRGAAGAVAATGCST